MYKYLHSGTLVQCAIRYMHGPLTSRYGGRRVHKQGRFIQYVNISAVNQLHMFYQYKMNQ